MSEPIRAVVHLTGDPGINVRPPVEDPASVANKPWSTPLVAQLGQPRGRGTKVHSNLLWHRQRGFTAHCGFLICLKIQSHEMKVYHFK